MSIFTSLDASLRSMIRKRELLTLRPFETDSEQGRSKERYRLIALAGLSGITAKTLAAFVGLASVPLTISYLGKEQFGLWMVTSSLIVWMQLTDLGLGNGLANALAEAHGREDRVTSRQYVATALVASSVLALVCLAIVLVLAHFIPWVRLLNLPDHSMSDLARSCFVVVGSLFAINTPLSIARRVLVARQQAHIANTAQMLASVLSLMGLILAISLKLDMISLVLAVSSATVLSNVFAWTVLVRSNSWLPLTVQSVTSGAFRRIARSSAPLFLFQIGALLVNQLVNIVVAQLGGLRMVADYNVVLKVYMLVFTIGVSFSAAFYPAIREAYERREGKWISRAVARALRIRLGVMLPAAMILLAFGDDLIFLWIHTRFEREFGILGWTAVVLSLLLAGTSSTLGEILTALDNIWPQVAIVFLSAFIVLTSMCLLIPAYGIAGIFFAMALSTLYPIAWSSRRLKLMLQDTAR